MRTNFSQLKLMNYKTLTVALAATLSLSLLTGRADDSKLDPSKLPPASSATGVTFEKDIKPIFDVSCMPCHKGEKAKAKLNLETAAGAVKGGKEGPDIIVGNSGKSPLVYAVAHIGDDDDFMPKQPKSGKKYEALTPAQIGLIRSWIDQGAK